MKFDDATMKFLREGNAVIGSNADLDKCIAANIDTRSAHNDTACGVKDAYVIWLAEFEVAKNIAPIRHDPVKMIAWTHIL